MMVVIGILALIGLAVVGAIGWAFVHGVRDGLAQCRAERVSRYPLVSRCCRCLPRCRAATRPASSLVRSQPAGAPHTRRPEQLEQASRPVHPGRRLWPWAVS